ncbi:MAG: hypothetical protein Q8M20_18110 [Rhodocyclaceae bacterium]|nr:hypothetical protein [Rhodocyclaceae bacterium]
MSVSIFPNTTTLSCKQALESALRDVDLLDDVLIVGTYKEDNSLFIVSSRLNRAQALWLAKMAELHALDND